MFVTIGSRAGRGLAAATPLYNDAASVAVPYASTVTLNFMSGQRVNFDIGTLTGNVTLANPINMKVGQSGRIKLTQDGTGNRTISYGSVWKTAGGSAVALSTTASYTDYLYYLVTSPTTIDYTVRKQVA